LWPLLWQKLLGVSTSLHAKVTHFTFQQSSCGELENRLPCRVQQFQQEVYNPAGTHMRARVLTVRQDLSVAAGCHFKLVCQNGQIAATWFGT
jgi:hypothetical protein